MKEILSFIHLTETRLSEGSVSQNNSMQQHTVQEILRCNDHTEQYALTLSCSEAKALTHTHTTSLKRFGRIAFSASAITKIIKAFCNSPFLSQTNYTDVLNELIEIFFYFKNETLDELGDDELISIMRLFFDETCRGCITLLSGRDLEAVARNIRCGIADYTGISENDEEAEYYEE